jgi:hypothetical protein
MIGEVGCISNTGLILYCNAGALFWSDATAVSAAAPAVEDDS